MRKLFLFISLLVVCVSSAQSFEERYKSFKQQTERDYISFRDNANQQYADFMRGAWEYYQAVPAVPAPKDKPIPPVIYENQHEQEEQITINEEPIVLPQPEPQPQPVEPITPSPAPHSNTCHFTFFNTPCKVRIPDKLFRLSVVNNDAYASAWEILSNGEYDVTLYDCLQLRETLQLCDWAYLLLLYEFSTNAYQATNNEATLLCAWLYCQSGYQMRLAQDGNRLHLLYASKHAIYGKSYFELDGYNYYTLVPASGNLQICTAAFEKEQALSLQIPTYPQFSAVYSNPRNLQSQRYPDLHITIQTNRSLIDFYDTYPSNEVNSNPLTRWAMYANTPLSDEMKQNIYPYLVKQLDGNSYREGVEQLLNFVQTAFVYEYDEKVWGEDRAFFAEETLHYPYADCEDRSIFFSRLVRDLLRLPVILVYYPGHLATAVAFPEQEHGDYILLNGQRFTICDPTYIGAPVGTTMPDMNNQTAQVIMLQ